MTSIHFTKKIVALVLSFLTASTLLFISCQKEISSEGFSPTAAQPDLTTKVSSSVSGFVTDETDAAVNGAIVKVGNVTTTTDKYGYFEVRNVSVVKTAAVVTISKTGYFNGIKTYIATANKAAFFRIKLIPKTIAGSIDAATGGAVTLTNGLKLTLPSNAVVTAASGAAYSGQVSVAASWLNPAAADIDRIMPGDLRGIDSDGYLKLLTTYGMSAVELSGSSGELLQIANGQKATLNFPLPATLAGSAPATIPLWYFDETNGLWKQQGSAAKSGDNYVGEVSHFSYWNCDVPLTSSVQFSCTIVDAAGHPVPNVSVSIYNSNGTYTGVHGFTDSTGYLSGPVPANAQLKLTIYGDYTCTNSAYSQDFTTANSDVALGNIVMSASSIASVSGNVSDCNSVSVSNGYVMMLKDGINYHYPIDSSGAFSFNATLCSSSSDVTFIAVDQNSQQSGNLTNFTLTAGTNAAGTLHACGNLINEFINYNINGTAYSVTAPADYLSQSVHNQYGFPAIAISGNSANSSPANNSAYFDFTQNGIAAGSTQNLQSFGSSNMMLDSLNQGSGVTITSPINVNITEYGAIGQFIAGNFAGTLTGPPPANTVFAITCNFRVRRYQ